MKQQYKAKMLRIHFIESDTWQGRPLHEAIIAQCNELGVDEAIAYRGLEGFGASTRIHHAHTLSISSNAPVMVSVIDTEEKIQQLLPRLNEMISGGLVAISAVEVLRYSRE